MRIFHAAVVSTLAGCSFIYTGDNLVGPGPDAGITDGSSGEGGGGEAGPDASTDVFVDNVPGVMSIDADVTHVYWCDTAAGTVLRRRNDGATTETIASKESSPRFVAVSSAHVYWTAGRSIRRIPVLGGAIETYTTASEEPSGLVFDIGTPAPALYWSERAAGRVMSRSTTGEVVFRSDLDQPRALGVDAGRLHVVLASGKLINFNFGGGILEVDVDTSAVKVAPERTFWTKPGNGSVVRQDVGKPKAAAVVDAIGPAAVTSDGAYVYWAEPSMSRIRRRKL